MTEFLSNAPLGRCCTFLTGGRADKLAFCYKTEELIAAASEGALVLGRGSNILVGDLGYRGFVAVNRTGDKLFGPDHCECDSGLLISALAREYARQGRTGLEWAYGLPGSIGGAVMGKAGAFGGCIADVTEKLYVYVDGKMRIMTAEECGFGYRSSNIRGTVVRVKLRAPEGDPAEINAACERNFTLRRQSQPIGASAGCVFKAADGVPAGQLIEQAGLKGLVCGGAEISPKHANFIVNRGGALSGDVLQLMNTAAAAVYDKFGVKLEREIKLYGDFC